MAYGSQQTFRGRQRASTREAVLAAAREAIRELGFQGTTIRAIAKAAGVSTGTVMHYGKSKEDLLYEAFHEDIERISADVFAALPVDRPLNRQLAHIGGEFLRRYAAEPDLYGDFLEHSLLARGDWGDRFTAQATRIGGRIGGLFREAVERGDLPTEIDVRSAVITFFSLYYFALLNQVKTRFADVDTAVEQLRIVIDEHYRGLQCRKSS